jgi:hypothetical protein
MTRYEAYIGKDWKEQGIANIVVARLRSDQPPEFSMFLVDLLCLGVKDAMYHSDMTESEYRHFLTGPVAETLGLSIHPACAKKMIEGAIEYAENLGFAPHRDYRKARRVLSGIDAADCPEIFSFGEENGRPCYVRGPDDSEERVDRVLSLLERKCGAEGFTYVDPEDDEDEEDELSAREDLMDWLDDEPESVPRFYEVSGLVTAMQLCPEFLAPPRLIAVLWPDKPGLADLEETQDFLTILKNYWNSVVGLIANALDPAAKEGETCIDLWEGEFEEEDSGGFILAMRDWARGFMRATVEWPGSWSEPLHRPDLAPHWEVLRCLAEIDQPGSAERIEQMGAENPPRTMGSSVAALTRALRDPMPR